VAEGLPSMTLTVTTPMPLNLENVNACINDVVTLEGPLGFDYYKWSNGEESRTTDEIADQDKKYTLEVRDINGCTNKADLELTVDNPYTDFTASQTGIRPADPVQFVVNSINETSTYKWIFGDNTDGTGSNVIHYYYNEGMYDVTLEIESVNHCTATNIKENYINVSENNPGVSVNESKLQILDIKLYPVPVKSILQIDASSYNQSNEIDVSIYNSSGQLMSSFMISPKDIYEFSMSDYPNGSYVVMMRVNDIISSQKIVKLD